eukprot:598570-Rhodomonas_salina.1
MRVLPWRKGRRSREAEGGGARGGGTEGSGSQTSRPGPAPAACSLQNINCANTSPAAGLAWLWLGLKRDDVEQPAARKLA